MNSISISKKDVEKYVIEIVFRARTIQTRCKRLLAQQYASKSPISLTKTLHRICHYLENSVVKIFQSIEWDAVDFDEQLIADLTTLKIRIRLYGI